MARYRCAKNARRRCLSAILEKLCHDALIEDRSSIASFVQSALKAPKKKRWQIAGDLEEHLKKERLYFDLVIGLIIDDNDETIGHYADILHQGVFGAPATAPPLRRYERCIASIAIPEQAEGVEALICELRRDS